MILPDDELKPILVNTGIVDGNSLKAIVDFANETKIPLQEAVLEKEIITEEKLGLLLANHFKYPFTKLSKLTIPELTFHIVPDRIGRKFKVVAFEKDTDSIKLAMSDPRDTTIQEFIAKKTNLKVIPYMATDEDINATLQVYKKDLQKTFDELLIEEMGKTALITTDAPIAKIVDLLISFAYRDIASDIHIEPEEKNSLVRFRIDGILHDVLTIDKKLHDRIITRIKVLSRLRTDEHLSAQDGKMRVLIDKENLDIRVSIIPISDGEKAVLRLLASHLRQLSLSDLGMIERDLKIVNATINKSYGMILSTGPTGSGKTTTIYAILKILNTREKNITTIEDPIEYKIKGVNQIQVNVKTNLTFANGLRSILRQDPNVIFVGEIRDSETAGIAVNAALTGHLVLSTLHTNDAATALPRLIDMKIEPFLVASTVNLIVAQRLVRKICNSCKIEKTINKSEVLKDIPEESAIRHFGQTEDIQVYIGQGCKICHYTGYSGRIGIFEVIEVTEKIKKLIVDKNDSNVIKREAIQEGMNTMLDDGLKKVAKGITTIEEVFRVTKVETL